MVKWLDDSLGKPVTSDYHTYDSECAFVWENLYHEMDHYFFIHNVN